MRRNTDRSQALMFCIWQPVRHSFWTGGERIQRGRIGRTSASELLINTQEQVGTVTVNGETLNTGAGGQGNGVLQLLRRAEGRWIIYRCHFLLFCPFLCWNFLTEMNNGMWNSHPYMPEMDGRAELSQKYVMTWSPILPLPFLTRSGSFWNLYQVSQWRRLAVHNTCIQTCKHQISPGSTMGQKGT